MELEELMSSEMMERLLHQSICYAKLVDTKYWNYLDPIQFAKYQQEVASLEVSDAGVVSGVVAGQMIDESRDKSYGKANRYSSANAVGRVQNFKQWVKMEGGEIAEHGLRSFIKSVDKLGTIVGRWIVKLQLTWKLRNVREGYALNKFKMISEYAQVRKKYHHERVKGPDVSLMMKRLDGYVNICDEIHNLAENSDEDAFDSDKTWDNFASASNKALYARPPSQGMFFRELERVSPYVHHFDLTTSDWCKPEAVQALAKKLVEVKESVIEKIKDDLDFIKDLVSGLKSDVTHNRGESMGDIVANADRFRKGRKSDEIDEMVVKYARGFVASKFVTQLQNCFSDECQYILEELPYEFSPNFLDKRKHKRDLKREENQKRNDENQQAMEKAEQNDQAVEDTANQ